MTAETFFKELQRLILSHPKRPAQILNSENCEYGNYLYYGKNLYNCFDCVQSAEGTYLFDTHNSANCADCDFTQESELCYESIDAYKCFNSIYLNNCHNLTDSFYSYDCTGCHDIFGCVRLKNKSFCIFNRQFSEEEYREKVGKYKALPPEKILAFVNGLYRQHPWTQTHEIQNENSPYGNYISYNKNTYMAFDASYNEYSGYLYDSSHNKYAYDVTQSNKIELSIEVTDSTQIFNCDYIVFSKNCMDSSYVFDCFDLRNSLGCIMTHHKQYCILNRQFSKEEYERISKPLLAELRSKNYGWGNLLY